MNDSLTPGRMPTVFISHGGGPCFFIDWNPPDTWKSLGAWLGGLAASLPARPKAIVVVSAHWEAAAFAVNAGDHPALLYDYYGFPESTYQLTYPAPGAPVLAERVRSLLAAAQLPAALEYRRGLDHGVFVPFKLIYPQADVPIVQLSLKAGLDPAEHLAAGLALAPLRDEGVLIVGSGYSYHNMRGYGGAGAAAAAQFDVWLAATVEIDDPAQRATRLRNWESAPSARASHPREEHLLPLMIAAGAAQGDVGVQAFSDVVFGVATSCFRFG